MVQANKAAPAIWTTETVVDAPIETVWRVLSDFAAWPRWNPSVSSIRLDGPVGVGTSFVWVADGSRIVSRLEEVDEPRRLAWSGKILGIRAMHVWEFEPRPSGTFVHTEESFEGLLARLFPGTMRKMLEKALTQGLAALKTEAESRHRGSLA
jgi:uncharacterized protein YndB with AHSA1/START domain